MVIIDRLPAVIEGGGRTTTVYECRRCGCTVDGLTEQCPYCETTDIVSYRIE